MNILIKSAHIIDVNSKHNGKTKDILIEGGVIKQIKQNVKADKNIKTIEHDNLHVSTGWFDMQANYCDPGQEYKEDLISGPRAAASGGFTGVALVPSTHPPVSSKADVEYIINKTTGNIVDIYPTGALSEAIEGKNISEMYDMWSAGAVAFTDDKLSAENTGVLLRALLYSQSFGGKILTFCFDKNISPDGVMNEGKISASLGLKGMPALAEEIIVARNIALADYTKSHLHISSISTEKSVQLIREAKKKKIKITASVNAYNLALTENLLTDFDTNYKTNPPLRSSHDVDALKKGISDGTIDVITSDHIPQDTESKKVEFDNAAFGIIGQETMFALINTYRGKIRLSKIIECITTSPRKILGLEIPSINENQKANITLFSTDKQWIVSEKHILSKSKNNPLIGKKLTGSVIGIYNKKMLRINGQ